MKPLKKMPFNILCFLLMLLVPFGVYSQAIAGGDTMAQKLRALEDENHLLKAELRLASKGMSYIILDLRTDSDSTPVRMDLKNRGMVLREFGIESMRYRGTKGFVIEPIPLLKKRAFLPPKRKEIKPLKPEESLDPLSEFEFMELKDMPSNYTLLFAKGLYISVIDHSGGFLFRRVINGMRSIVRHIRYSFTMVWNYLLKKECTILEIAMGREDAQTLFWSLDLGMPIVVVEKASI
jgi:hypothetical protein